jgi:ectoine hydroxylase-related dioxygenase (phytanoyl-CoA dioxygenase family)
MSSSESFACDGFVIIKEFLTSWEVAQMRSAIELREISDLDHGCARPHNTLLALRWNDSIVQKVLCCGNRVARLAAAVGADDLRWISGYVSVKEPYSPPLWWHQDWWCWDHPVTYQTAAVQIAVLIYLMDVGGHNGGLRLLPGSHRRSSAIHALLPEAHSENTAVVPSDHPAMTDAPGQVTPRAFAGDAVVIDYRLLHGTHGNGTDARRHCILLSFTPCWRSLPEDIRAHLISHLAQPIGDEHCLLDIAKLLPDFDGVRQDLCLNRNAPAEFDVR